MLNMRRLSILIVMGLFALSSFVIAGSFGLGWSDDPGPPVVNASSGGMAVVTDHPDMGGMFGMSHLVRTDEGIGFTLNTTGLAAGTGYTLWVFIDDDEETFPAPLADLERYEIRMQMGGEFAASDGSGQFSSFFPAGELPNANGMNVLTTTDDGMFDNPMTADVLLAVRWHGPRRPNFGYEQTHFVNGGPKTNMTVQEAIHDAP